MTNKMLNSLLFSFGSITIVAGILLKLKFISEVTIISAEAIIIAGALVDSYALFYRPNFLETIDWSFTGFIVSLALFVITLQIGSSKIDPTAVGMSDISAVPGTLLIIAFLFILFG